MIRLVELSQEGHPLYLSLYRYIAEFLFSFLSVKPPKCHRSLQ